MRSRWLIAAPVVIAATYAVTVSVQHRIDGLRPPVPADELRYMPGEKILGHFTAGMRGVIADFIWIQCLQYTGRHYKGDHDYAWLEHLLVVVTQLDPHFVPAYRYGGIFLSMLKADDDASLKLLHRGMVRNPFAWELPYEAAMTYLLNRPDEPQTPVRAARYLAMAVETGNAPPFVAEAAAGLQDRLALGELERSMWENTLKSGNPLMRDLARRKLVELDLRATCEEATKAVQACQQRTGKRPSRVEEVVAGGYLSAMPKDPAHGSFFIDSDGKVQSTTLLDVKTERAFSTLKSALDRFYAKFNRWPESLQELVDKGVIGQIPPHPYPWRRWRYNSFNGDVFPI